MKLRDQKLESPDLNLTPLIDVVFLLLIFFMVSTSFDQHKQIKLKLPEVGSGAANIEDSQVINVSINAEGEYLIEGRLLKDSSKQELSRLLSKVVAEKPESMLVISGDKSVNYQQVVEVMDVAHQLNLLNITLKSRSIRR